MTLASTAKLRGYRHSTFYELHWQLVLRKLPVRNVRIQLHYEIKADCQWLGRQLTYSTVTGTLYYGINLSYIYMGTADSVPVWYISDI
jgi:hypothetical protein